MHCNVRVAGMRAHYLCGSCDGGRALIFQSSNCSRCAVCCSWEVSTSTTASAASRCHARRPFPRRCFACNRPHTSPLKLAAGEEHPSTVDSTRNAGRPKRMISRRMSRSSGAAKLIPLSGIPSGRNQTLNPAERRLGGAGEGHCALGLCLCPRADAADIAAQQRIAAASEAFAWRRFGGQLNWARGVGPPAGRPGAARIPERGSVRSSLLNGRSELAPSCVDVGPESAAIGPNFVHAMPIKIGPQLAGCGPQLVELGRSLSWQTLGRHWPMSTPGVVGLAPNLSQIEPRLGRFRPMLDGLRLTQADQDWTSKEAESSRLRPNLGRRNLERRQSDVA